MVQMEIRSEAMEKASLPNLMPADLAAMGKKTIEEFAKAQAELLRTLQETQRRWLDRIQSETAFASEFAHKVGEARCIPDAMAACQEWTSRRFVMMADDGNQLLADSRKVMETGARFLSKGLFAEQGGAGAEASGEDRQGRPRFRGGAERSDSDWRERRGANRDGRDGDEVQRHGRDALRDAEGDVGE